MQRVMMGVVLSVVLTAGLLLRTVWGADLQVIQTHKAKDMVVTLLSESGQWTQGKNTFVLECTSATTKQPVDVGKVILSTSMPRPARQVTVAWDCLAGKGSTQFSVPVR